jgi:hypothetical protein
VLTVFSVPKPFVGHIGLIQRNALESWRALSPECEIVLFGDEAGVDEAAAAIAARHEPEVARTEHGTPRVDDLFARARRLARFETLCFVNCDILLPPELLAAFGRVRERFPRFLALGQCRNLDVAEPAADLDWQRLACEQGTMRPPGGIDYLNFPRDLYDRIPSFALGRAGFDNWLVWDVRRRRIPVVDLTAVVTAVHQNHDYGHVRGGRDEAYHGVEARENIRLAGGELRLFNISDADYRLEPDGFARNRLAPVRRVGAARWLALRFGELRRAAAG